MIDVSVVVPVYNVEKYLEESLQTILEQSHRNIEIILVNDGSTDKSGEICDTYAKKDERIKVIHQSNTGVGLARNAGMAAANGKYIYFSDSDDWLYPDLIKDNWELAEKNNAELVIFGYDLQYRDVDGNLRNGKSSNIPKLSGCYRYDTIGEDFSECIFYSLTVWTRLYRLDWLRENQLIFSNQKVSEDTLFNLEAFACPLKNVVFNQKVYYCHARRLGSAERYHPELVTYQYRTIRAVEKLGDAKGLEKLQKDKFLNVFYFRMLSTITGNLSDVSCDLTVNEKMNVLKPVLRDPRVKKAISDLTVKDCNSSGAKTKLALMKIGCYRAVLLLGALKKKAKHG